MRILLTIFLCAAILGGVGLFTSRKPAPPAMQVEPHAAANGEVAGLVLELYATTAMGADPFALSAPGGEDAQAALTVQRAQETLATLESVEPFVVTPIALPPQPRAQVELLVTGSPTPGDMAPRQGLQLRVLSGAAPLYETTVWSEGGLPFTATLPLDLRHVQ